MCQYFVGKILQLIRVTFPDAYIIHYMDDILTSHACSKQLHKIFETTQKALQIRGLVIASEKIQTTTPFQYLGHAIEQLTIHSQKSAIRRDSLKTLNDFQKLLGDINWLHPSLGIPHYKFANLFSILEGDTALNSP
jgi:hypothetical protein